MHGITARLLIYLLNNSVYAKLDIFPFSFRACILISIRNKFLPNTSQTVSSNQIRGGGKSKYVNFGLKSVFIYCVSCTITYVKQFTTTKTIIR